MKAPILQTKCPNLKLKARGKVRDIYEVGDHILLVATDRISTFDVVFPNGVPDKGRVLTQISRYWFEHIAGITPNHVVSFDVAKFPRECQAYADQLEGRSLLCRKAVPLTIECVVRGYLDGSAWREYQDNQGLLNSGHRLPAGLKQRSRLAAPIFTPATKEQEGHDINITEARAAEIVGKEVFEEARRRALAIYSFAHEHLHAKGITLCDTKFEFGITAEGELILIDEVLTPDSSRFMVKDSYAPGAEPISFDKQFVRDWVVGTGWNKTPPAPEIPEAIVMQTRERYLDVYKLITGKALGA
jgi:phosphoribosylaminoimidazole-succinocarboxamide synthase